MRHLYQSIPKTFVACLIVIAVTACGVLPDSKKESETRSEQSLENPAVSEATAKPAERQLQKTAVIEGPAFTIEQTRGTAGSQLVMPLKVIGVEGLAGFKVTIAIDPRFATFSGVEQGDFVGSFLFAGNIDVDQGWVSIAAVADEGVSGSGELAILTAELRTKGEAQIVLTIEEVLDEGINPIIVKPYAGTLTIE